MLYIHLVFRGFPLSSPSLLGYLSVVIISADTKSKKAWLDPKLLEPAFKLSHRLNLVLTLRTVQAWFFLQQGKPSILWLELFLPNFVYESHGVDSGQIQTIVVLLAQFLFRPLQLKILLRGKSVQLLGNRFTWHDGSSRLCLPKPRNFYKIF